MSTKAFTIFNIGKANLKIEELSARIAELESAKPADQSAQLADVLASNDQISAELTTAKDSASKAQSDLAAKTSAYDQLSNCHKSLNAELSKACLAANCLELDLKPEATEDEKQASAEAMPMADKLKAFAGAATAAILKTGLDVAKIPKGAAKTESKSPTKSRAEFDSLNFQQRNDFIRSGGKLTE